MFNTTGLMSSNRSTWKTPKVLYDNLDRMFHFDFDPCPPNPTWDGLAIEWGNNNYVNPPYGSEIKHWIKKAYEEYHKGKRVVMLIPARTDTIYWHEYVMKADEIWFIKGRLKFDDQDGPAPFPSAIVIFDGMRRSSMPKVKSVDVVGNELFEIIE